MQTWSKIQFPLHFLRRFQYYKTVHDSEVTRCHSAQCSGCGMIQKGTDMSQSRCGTWQSLRWQPCKPPQDHEAFACLFSVPTHFEQMLVPSEKCFFKKNLLRIYNYTINFQGKLSGLIFSTIISTVQRAQSPPPMILWQSDPFGTAHPARINTGESRNSLSPFPPHQDLTCGGNIQKNPKNRLIILHQSEQSQKMHITRGSPQNKNKTWNNVVKAHNR